MGKRRMDGNHSPQKKIIQFKTQREMEKMDIQFLTPTKQ
jgi:hypothetical protein